MQGHEYDIQSKKYGKVKIRQDRLAHSTHKFLLPLNKSIHTWLVVDNEYVSLVPAKHAGYLDRDEILKSPDIEKVERWFSL